MNISRCHHILVELGSESVQWNNAIVWCFCNHCQCHRKVSIHESVW